MIFLVIFQSLIVLWLVRENHLQNKVNETQNVINKSQKNAFDSLIKVIQSQGEIYNEKTNFSTNRNGFSKLLKSTAEQRKSNKS